MSGIMDTKADFNISTLVRSCSDFIWFGRNHKFRSNRLKSLQFKTSTKKTFISGDICIQIWRKWHRKLRVGAFDWWKNERLRTSIYRDTGDSNRGLKSLDLVEIGLKLKKSAQMDITRSRYDQIENFERFIVKILRIMNWINFARNITLIWILKIWKISHHHSDH